VRVWSRLNIPDVDPLHFEEWLDRTSYSVGRKAELQLTYDSLRGGLPALRKAGHVDSFVKTECYPCYKNARMINSRHDCFKCFSGPYIKALEDVVYESDHYIKHIPVADRWQRVLELKKSYKYYYATDYTAFESHFTPRQMFNIECQLYRKAFRHDAHIDYLIRVLTGENRCRTRTGMRCKIQGRRMSGDMNTSLGNGVSNMFLIMYLMHLKGLREDEYDFLVEGDDGLIATNVELSADDFLKLGFTIKIDRVDDPCHASFCGLICTDEGVNIRDPVRFFEKFGWTSSCPTAGLKVMYELLKAKCLSALCETPLCPIVAQAAFTCLQKCGDVRPRFSQDWYHVGLSQSEVLAYVPCAPNIPMSVRLLFDKIFQIDVPTQLYLEERIRKMDFNALAQLPFHPDLFDYTLKYVATC
jgi:hypothetical protein